jgi:hypothetical protein
LGKAGGGAAPDENMYAHVFLFDSQACESDSIGPAPSKGIALWAIRRNLDRRVEILFPILDAAHRKQIKKDLELMLKDNLKARRLKPDGTYEPITNNGKPLNSQLFFLNEHTKSS